MYLYLIFQKKSDSKVSYFWSSNRNFVIGMACSKLRDASIRMVHNRKYLFNVAAEHLKRTVEAKVLHKSMFCSNTEPKNIIGR